MKFPDVGGGSGLTSQNFIKLKDGDSLSLVFRGDPFLFRLHWFDRKATVCPGHDKCQVCQAGKKSSFRFRIGVVVSENGNYIPKIFEQGLTVYESLKALSEEFDLEKNVVKVSRKGSEAHNTAYSLIPKAGGGLTDVQLQAIAAVKMHDLTNFEAPPERLAQTVPPQTDEDIPF